MKLIGAIFLLIVFVSPIYAQDLFDRAEIEFDIDYIDIDKVKVIGGTINGQVMEVWMKSGSVLTKTLSKSNSEEGNYYTSSPPGGSYGYSMEHYGNEPYDKPNISDLRKRSKEELILRANDIINGEWHARTTFELFDVIFALKLNDNKGSDFVQLTMDVIKANLKYENRPRRLLAERDMMLQFAEGDEQLTKMANDFLEENGFNKEEK